MRILFVLATPEYFRYYDRALLLLAERGHQVDIAFTRQREGKPGLSGLSWTHPRVNVVGEVPRRGDSWERVARGLRGITDFSRYLDARYAGAPSLRARMKRKALPTSFAWLDWLPSLPHAALRPWLHVLAACEAAIPSAPVIDAFVARLNPDLVAVTPLVDFGAVQVDVVKSARDARIPVTACIASWDNLTNKGLMRVIPDRVLVWNDAQRREAEELHGVPADRVVMTGAQVFDRWFETSASSTREQWCRQFDLDPSEPIILYTCSSSFIAPAPQEIAFVRDWITAVRSTPFLARANVLVRPHPFNVWEWKAADFSGLGRVAVHPRQAFDPLTEETRTAFYDALYHSSAVVGVNTSAMIEAAILRRPVLSIVTRQFAATQEGTLHFRHLVPDNGGFVQIAQSFDEHIRQLSTALTHGDEWRERTDRFVERFLRPLGRDRACTPVLADALEQAAALTPERASARALDAPLRVGVRTVAALVWPIEELASEKPFGPLRKWVRTTAHRWRKEAKRPAL